MPVGRTLCNCVRGSGADLEYTAADMEGYDAALALDVQPEAAVQAGASNPYFMANETTYPVGSVAELAAPFPVDTGLFNQPRLVSTFQKKANGRWLSVPGGDVSYPTLSALALAAPVQTVYPAEQPSPQPGPKDPPAPKGWEDSEIFFPPVLPGMPEGPVIDAPKAYNAAQAMTEPPNWMLVGAAAVAGLVLLAAFDRRRRR